MKIRTFPQNFVWGAATAAYQIEGAYNADGKGESIWDRFTHQPGNILHNDTGDVACDHYHLMAQDVQLMKDLGLKSYRFSISWPRIFPAGRGQINQRGLDFYKRLINQLLKADISPMATLYHWDLPQKLQEIGGWVNRDVAKYFVEYANLLFQELGELVPQWITFNEPWVIAFCGHAFGEMAPGFTSYQTALEVSHLLLVAHGMTVQSFRQTNCSGEIGITLNLTPAYPASQSVVDQKSAQMQNDFVNNWYLQPLFKGSYPEELFKFYHDKVGEFSITDGDLTMISQEIDFLGINNYSRNLIKHNPTANLLETEEVKLAENEYTEMGWEVYPEGIYDLLLGVKKEYNPKAIYITENGAAYADQLTQNRVHDSERIAYLKGHLRSLHKAIEQGVPLKGYYVWSLFDNFEWAFGYSKRFGLIYIDYDKLTRIFKDSAYWYQQVIKNNYIEE